MSAVASDQSRINNQSKNNNKNITLITMDSSLDISGESMFPTPRHDTSPVREGRQTLSESRRSPAYDGLSAYRRSPSPALEEARTKEQIRQLKSQVKQLQTENNAEMETSAQLRRRINQLERDKVELTSTSNDETSKLQSQVAKLRSQVEKGEAIKQTLEYELTLAKKNVSQEQRLAADREMDLNSVIAANKERVAVLCDEVEDLQRKLERNMTSTSDEAHKLRKIIDEKDAVIAKCYAEQDYLQAEKDRLEIVIQEKDGETDDAEQKISSLEMERNTQSETVRRQLGDLEYAAEKEDRLKKDLEVAVNRIKSLEENIEAERAAHLESKFNSEIVQLRVRDLEGALEVEKSARSESTVNADLLNSQLRELESLYEEERKNAKNLKAQLDKVSKEYETVKKQLTHEIDDKSSMISNLSKQLELHQKNFNELKDELNKVFTKFNLLDPSSDLIDEVPPHEQVDELPHYTDIAGFVKLRSDVHSPPESGISSTIPDCASPRIHEFTSMGVLDTDRIPQIRECGKIPGLQSEFSESLPDNYKLLDQFVIVMDKFEY